MYAFRGYWLFRLERPRALASTAAELGCAGLNMSAATMLTDWHTKTRVSAHAETEFQGVRWRRRHGLAMG